jgi:hypothetical protein
MHEMLAFSVKDIFPNPWLQIPGLLLLIGLIVFWVIYRRRQM